MGDLGIRGRGLRLTVHDEQTSPLSVETQFRWLVAALRNESHEASFDRREGFARKLEWVLIGPHVDLAARLRRVLRSADAVLLVRLARWHEDVAQTLQPGPERTSHVGRAHRYREIAEMMRIWV